MFVVEIQTLLCGGADQDNVSAIHGKRYTDLRVEVCYLLR